MSGGHFEYRQYNIDGIAEDIERLIATNDDNTEDEWGDQMGRGYSSKTIKRFEEAVHTLRKAAKMVQRVDWLVSGDDGEDGFHERWEKTIEKNKDE